MTLSKRNYRPAVKIQLVARASTQGRIAWHRRIWYGIGIRLQSVNTAGPDLEEVRGNKARKFKDLWMRLVQMKRDSSNGMATDSTTTTAAANVSTSVESEDEDSMSTSSSTGQKVLCSYGGEQSNAMLALARMASALGRIFVVCVPYPLRVWGLKGGHIEFSFDHNELSFDHIEFGCLSLCSMCWF